MRTTLTFGHWTGTLWVTSSSLDQMTTLRGSGQGIAQASRCKTSSMSESRWRQRWVSQILEQQKMITWNTFQDLETTTLALVVASTCLPCPSQDLEVDSLALEVVLLWDHFLTATQEHYQGWAWVALHGRMACTRDLPMALEACRDKADQADQADQEAHPLGNMAVVDPDSGREAEFKGDMIVDRATGATVITMAQDITLMEVEDVDGVVAGLTKTGEEVEVDSGEALVVDSTKLIPSMQLSELLEKGPLLYFYQPSFLVIPIS